MEVYAPFYGSVSSSQALTIARHHSANGTKPFRGQSCNGQLRGRCLDNSKARGGKKFKTPKKIFRKLKKISKKKKVWVENKVHESISRSSSYGSCSSSSSADEITGPFNAYHECAKPSCKGEFSKKGNKEKWEQEQPFVTGKDGRFDLISSGKYVYDARSGEYDSRDAWKKHCNSEKHKGGQKVHRKRQCLESSTHAEVPKSSVGLMKGTWKKFKKSKKKNKTRKGRSISQVYAECNDLKGIITTNCEKLSKRNEKLEDLQYRGEKLVKQCQVFSRQADQIKNDHASCWTRMCETLRRLCCCCCGVP